MAAQYTYLLVDLCCIVVPLLASFHPAIRFHRQWRHFVLPWATTALFFLSWDMLFTWWGVWSFNPHYLVGLYVGNLPLEEVIFFLCIPYACTFTYYCCSIFVKRSFSPLVTRIITISLVNVLLILGFTHLSHLYTSVTFFLLGGLLSWLALARKAFLSTFYLAYLLILLPFFISNGILTGSMLDAPVVVYNNHQNMNFRIGTIPVEDIFYGMLLMLMIVTGYEFAIQRPFLPWRRRAHQPGSTAHAAAGTNNIA